MSKSLQDRFEKDFNGLLTILLILGIILEGEHVWTSQIKKRFKEITQKLEGIPTSTLYANLSKLENIYGLIKSKNDEIVQRRFYFPTKKGIREFQALQEHWIILMSKSKDAIYSLDINKNYLINEDMKTITNYLKQVKPL